MALLFHTFSIPKHWYVFDANRNSILPIRKEEYEALSEIEHKKETPENLEVLHKFQEKGFCCEAHIEMIKHPDTDTLFAHQGRRLQQTILQVTQRCNLRCSYCAYTGLYYNQQRTHGPRSMSLETAKRAIDFALAHSDCSKSFNLAFYGGEPLLEFPLIKECIEYIRFTAPDRDVRFNMTTNGTLLTPEIYIYLINNGFNLLISLDGPQPIHDMTRKFADGSGSYNIIMKNIGDIIAQYPEAKEKIRFNAVADPEMDESCLQSLFHLDDVLDYYNMRLSPMSPLYTEKDLNYNEAFSVCYNQEICKHLLCLLNRLDEQYVSKLVFDDGEIYKSENDLLRNIARIPSVTHPGGPCKPGVQRLFIDVDGNFFPCERVSEKSQPMNIGNLDSGFDFEKAKALLNVGQITEKQCKECWTIFHCSMCAAFADDLDELSKSKRLSNCLNVRRQYENKLKEHCFLKENGYHFERVML